MKKMPRFHAAVIAFATLSVLAACVTLQSFDQRLAAANVAFTGAVNSATKAVQLGVISVEDGKKLRVVMEETKTILDEAKAISDLGDLSTAEAKMELAVGLITQIQNYLIKEQKDVESSRNRADNRSSSRNNQTDFHSRERASFASAASTAGRPLEVERRGVEESACCEGRSADGIRQGDQRGGGEWRGEGRSFEYSWSSSF